MVTLTIERRFQVRESEKTMKTKILFAGKFLEFIRKVNFDSASIVMLYR